MQKVEGSSPFSRSSRRPAFAGLLCFWGWLGSRARSAADPLGPLSVRSQSTKLRRTGRRRRGPTPFRRVPRLASAGSTARLSVVGLAVASGTSARNQSLNQKGPLVGGTLRDQDIEA